MARRRKGIEDETCIMPGVVADGVVQEVAVALEDARGELPEAACAFLDDAAAQRAMSDRLAARADETYKASDTFAKRINGRGDSGRDTLYAFSRHWAAADVRSVLGEAAFQALPEGFANGEEPAPRAAPGPR